VLKDPSQKSIFSANDLRDLFSFTESVEQKSESSVIFSHADAELEVSEIAENRVPSKKSSSSDGESDDEPAQEDNSEEAKGEKRLISLLFDSGDLTEAFSHEKVVNYDLQEAHVVKERAHRIAEKALEALRNSREAIGQATIGVPTWTGKFGAAGLDIGSSNLRPSTSALSSSSILSAIEDRKRLLHETSSSSSSSSSSADKYQRLTRDLQSELRNYPNGLSSDSLSRRFVKEMQNSQDQAVFKKVLKEIAQLKPDARGNKLWILKRDFR
jgi:DNA excision repair protein ERCC-6